MSGLNDAAREQIGIDDRDAALDQDLRRGGFAHADAAGQPE